MIGQVFISSYWRDFPWLGPCLRSLAYWSDGFLEPVVCVSAADYDGACRVVDEYCPAARVVVRDGHGFMRAQIAMMEADLFCPKATTIFLVGSDCLAVGPFRAQDYCDAQRRPYVLMTHRETLARCHAGAMPWLVGTERVLGFAPQFEYMRRLPSVFDWRSFGRMREFVEARHGMRFEDYIYEGQKVDGCTSEANILGAFTHAHAPELSNFVDVGEAGMYGAPIQHYPNTLAQMWSHGGLDYPTDSRFEIDGVPITGRTPRDIIESETRKMRFELAA